jgi:pyruvate dehydrogenase kinase 2/3/4
MLVSRISRRVLAEHHIALSDSVAGKNQGASEEGHIGIIYTGLNVEKSVRRCSALLHQLTHDPNDSGAPNKDDIQWPGVTIEGHIGAQFAYIREHLESASPSSVLTYHSSFVQVHHLRVVEECAFSPRCATHDEIYVHLGHASYCCHAWPKVGPSRHPGHPSYGTRQHRDADLGSRYNSRTHLAVYSTTELGGGLLNPQIRSPSDLFSFSHVRNASRLEPDYLGPLRTASASTTGMRATVEELVSRWRDEWRQREDGTSLKNDPELKSGVGCQPRLGIGLAMCNIFARCTSLLIYIDAKKLTYCVRYFGGSLELVSLDGWGEAVRPGDLDMQHAYSAFYTGTDVYLRLPKLVGCIVRATCMLPVNETAGY